MKAVDTLVVAKAFRDGVTALVNAPSDSPDAMPEEVKPVVISGTRLLLGLFVNIARIADAVETLAAPATAAAEEAPKD